MHMWIRSEKVISISLAAAGSAITKDDFLAIEAALLLFVLF